MEFIEDLSQLSLHDCGVDLDEGSVDGCGAPARFGPGFQGDLVAVALDPLPQGEFPCLPLRDAQEQISGLVTLQGEGEIDALNSSNSREESEKHQGAVQLVSVLREWDKGCG